MVLEQPHGRQVTSVAASVSWCGVRGVLSCELARDLHNGDSVAAGPWLGWSMGADQGVP